MFTTRPIIAPLKTALPIFEKRRFLIFANAEAAASLEKVVAAKEDPSVRYSLGILYAYYLEQPDKGLEQLQKALDNPNTPADLKKAVSEEVTKIKEHKNHTPQQAQ